MGDTRWMSAAEVTAAVRSRKISAAEVCRQALDRIASDDPKLRAFVSVTPEIAARAAAGVDARISRGEDPGPLAGVPVALKDNICLAGAETTCASRMLKGFRPPYTATAAARLIAAGAVIVGKTNMDEFAMGSSTENSAFGVTHNPWALDRTPGGSSGGSAAAVAAGMVPLALGSDTGGSIRQPAAFCGVCGLKPTYGRVSRYGLIAFASSLDQIGPIARDAADMALALSVISGRDGLDATSAERPAFEPARDMFLSDSLKGLRIGVPGEYFAEGLDPEVERAVKSAIETLEDLGASVSGISLPHTRYAVATYYLIATAEASSNLARYDGMHFGYRTSRAGGLFDTYAVSRAEGFGAEVKRRIMLGTYALSAGYYDAYYMKALKVRALIRRDFLRAFESVDVIVCPTSPTPPFRLGEKISDPLAMYLSDIFTISCNLAAIPGLSIPCGRTAMGLPIGMQLLGRDWEEGCLLRV
ncbi:MAG: Asp-tRNA(Asn)/Glu-tRNA(Gln) amidotransferase subunit GatA, partial [Planctomycetota bacterium]|nr:Asp-tRNA(Asn)/Glu-tRNA(Gln) amidotransferase subunit GatA [Planctomycetota bacterium]